MRGFAILIILVLGVCGAVMLHARERARIALLIGNQAYADKVGTLKNPHHDVARIAASLKRLGFKVTVVKDAGYLAMDEAVRRYVDRVRRAGPGAISFFYYSGHGAANPENQVNYLIPVDVTITDTADLWYQSLEQSSVIDKLSKRAPGATHFVVFDACRNELNLTGSLKKGLSDEKGFVPVNDVRGMLIAYATGEKRTASDSGKFAEILAEELPKKGVEAVEMFRRVQLRAQRELRQEPWMSLRYLPPVYLGGTSATELPTVDADAEAERRRREMEQELERQRQAVAKAEELRRNALEEMDRARQAAEAAKLEADEAEKRAASLSHPKVTESNTVGRRSYWMHNGSLVSLTAQGVRRSFIYENPRQGMREEGVTRGTLLFKGEKNGRNYVGIAYVFSGRCGKAFPYGVRGYVSDDDRRVTLLGSAPSHISESCQVLNYRNNDKLVFTFDHSE